jgi:hypothetical protein
MQLVVNANRAMLELQHRFREEVSLLFVLDAILEYFRGL